MGSNNISSLNRNKARVQARIPPRVPRNPPLSIKQFSELKLSHCAAKYAAAISNPWSPHAVGACIPWGDSRQSQKVTSFTRFDAVVGTGGVGFVLVSPTICSDLPYAWSTSSAFTGSSASVATLALGTTSTTGVSANSMANLPYTVAQLANGTTAGYGGQLLKGRIVSVGLSASYTGTELNMGGLMYCYVDGTHGNLNNATIASLGSRTEADVSNVSRDKCWLMASAIDTDEMEFPPLSINTTDALTTYYPYSRGQFLDATAANGAINNGGATMVVMFTGVAGNTVHFEIVQHTEYIGILTEGKGSENVLDPEGALKVLSAANKVPMMKQNRPNKSYGELFYEALVYTGKELLPVAVTALKGMLI